MRFFDRLGRLVKSDAHGIMDQLEERSLLLKQHLRDAELALNEKRDRAESLEDEQRRLREEEQRLDARLAALDEDVELALAGEKEELARFAVRRLIPVRETSLDVKARIAKAAARHERISECLAAQELQFEELKHGVEARLAEVRHERTAPPVTERSVADEEVELELLRRARGVRVREGTS